MPTDHDRTDAFRGARLTRSDLSGAVLRDCDLRGVRITGSWLDGLSLSGEFERLVVDEVDVTAFVAAELDRRHPERTADDHRAAWEVLQQRWAETVERARRLPERGVPFSAVVAEALTGWMRGRLVDAWLAEHQAEHGTFDEAELRELAAETGVPYLAAGRTGEPAA